MTEENTQAQETTGQADVSGADSSAENISKSKNSASAEGVSEVRTLLHLYISVLRFKLYFYRRLRTDCSFGCMLIR